MEPSCFSCIITEHFPVQLILIRKGMLPLEHAVEIQVFKTCLQCLNTKMSATRVSIFVNKLPIDIRQ